MQDRLAGLIIAPNGAAVRGPVVPWNGRRRGRRQDQRWATAWRRGAQNKSPALPIEFPDNENGISHEAIYQALYVQDRGGLRRELTRACGPAEPAASRGRRAEDRARLHVAPRC